MCHQSVVDSSASAFDYLFEIRIGNIFRSGEKAATTDQNKMENVFQWQAESI